MKVKRNQMFLQIAALGILAGSPVLAQDGAVKVSVDSAPVLFTGQQPINDRGHVMVPLRGVFEKMGAKVGYDAASHQVTAKSDNSSVELNVGSTKATVDGKPITLDAPTKITNGAVLVPLRFVSESLGSAVKFDKASQTVLVDTSKTPAPSQGAADPAGGATAGSTSSTTPPAASAAPAASATPSSPPAAAPTGTSPAGTPSVIINNTAPSSIPPATAAPVQTAPAPAASVPAASVPVSPAPSQDPPAASRPIVVNAAPVESGFAWLTFLPYIIGALILLGVLAWYLNRRGKTGQVIAANDKKSL